MAPDRPYRVILTFVDGSPSSEAAAEVAAELAARSGATLHLAGATTLPEQSRGMPGGETSVTAEPGTGEYHEHLEQHLLQVATRLGDTWGCPVETVLLTGRDPQRDLREHERRVDVDLTVIGVVPPPPPGHGDDDPARPFPAVPGGEIPGPLLLVPVGDVQALRQDPDRTAGGTVVALLGPHDTTADASVPACAAAFARAAGDGELWLLDAAPAGTLLEQDRVDPGHLRPEERSDETERRLEALAHGLSAADDGLRVRHRVLHGDQDDSLRDVLRDHAVRTVAIGVEGRPIAERLLFAPDGRSEADGPSNGPPQVLVCAPRERAG